jgi:hypothetical protein
VLRREASNKPKKRQVIGENAAHANEGGSEDRLHRTNHRYHLWHGRARAFLGMDADFGKP